MDLRGCGVMSCAPSLPRLAGRQEETKLDRTDQMKPSAKNNSQDLETDGMHMGHEEEIKKQMQEQQPRPPVRAGDGMANKTPIQFV